jgi:flagellar biosynthesis/type III secretory pathway protein FliH
MQEGIQEGVQQGIQQGMQQGIYQGIQEGESTMLMLQLKSRFNDIPAHYLELIRQASNDTLLSWGKRLLDAASLEEVFSVE